MTLASRQITDVNAYCDGESDTRWFGTPLCDLECSDYEP